MSSVHGGTVPLQEFTPAHQLTWEVRGGSRGKEHLDLRVPETHTSQKPPEIDGGTQELKVFSFKV